MGIANSPIVVSDINLIPNTKELEFLRGMADYKSVRQMNLYLFFFKKLENKKMFLKNKKTGACYKPVGGPTFSVIKLV